MKSDKLGYTVLISTAIAAVIGIFLFVDPILQSEEYHNFSDARTYFSIPNFWNVISNIPFLIVGVFGLIHWKYIKGANGMHIVMFAGIVIMSGGSAYYHWAPDNDTLVWDRLPMTIVFMSLFSIVITEFISPRAGKLLFIPLILIGLLSIAYWVYSSSGDLRPYVLVQFYPMIAIPIIIIFFKSGYTLESAYWMLLILYVIAKIFEYFDAEIYHLLVQMSGHSLKHIAAAIGLYLLLNSYRKREIVKN